MWVLVSQSNCNVTSSSSGKHFSQPGVSQLAECPSSRVPEPCVFLRLKKFRGISGFKSHTGIFLSVGIVFLLSRFFQQSLFKQLPVLSFSRWKSQRCSSGLWVCAIESIPGVIWVRNEPPITVYCWITVLLNVCFVIKQCSHWLFMVWNH